MRDGTRLRADLYLPRGTGPFPTLICRTPYSKERDIHVETAEQFAERGYLAIVQDVRGRYASDGTFRPGFYSADHCDAEDGYDTVEWAAQLPWSDGKVGTFGNSYCGWTQWELAHMRPPHLVAMLPQGIAANLLDRELSGVLRLGRVLWWSINTLAPDERRRAGDTSGPHTTDEAERLWEERDRSKWLWYLPLADIPDAVMYGVGEHWRGWLADHTTDFFGFLEKHRQVAVPALNITGWYDQQIGTIKHFTGMREQGMTARAQGAPASHHRSVDAHEHGLAATARRRGLRAGGAARLLRDGRSVVSLLAAGRAERGGRLAAHPPVRHGCKPVARRAGVAAGAHGIYRVLPA